MQKTPEELVQRAHDAQVLLNHYLIKEFFCDIDELCYTGIVHSKHTDVVEREHLYTLAKTAKMLKSLFDKTIESGKFEKEQAIRKIRNINE